jgi:hypothetical protein
MTESYGTRRGLGKGKHAWFSTFRILWTLGKLACWFCGKFAASLQITTACPQLGDFLENQYPIEIMFYFTSVLLLRSNCVIFFPSGLRGSDNWYRTWMDFNP